MTKIKNLRWKLFKSWLKKNWWHVIVLSYLATGIVLGNVYGSPFGEIYFGIVLLLVFLLSIKKIWKNIKKRWTSFLRNRKSAEDSFD